MQTSQPPLVPVSRFGRAAARLWARFDSVRSCEDTTPANDRLVRAPCVSRMPARRTHRPPHHLVSTTAAQMLGNLLRNSNRRSRGYLYDAALSDVHKLLGRPHRVTPTNCAES